LIKKVFAARKKAEMWKKILNQMASLQGKEKRLRFAASKKVFHLRKF